MIMLQTKLLTPTAILPTRGTDEAAGLDLYADMENGKDVYLMPGKRCVLKTGIATAIPKGYYGQVAPRSGLAVKKGLEVLAGVIDSDYRGELMVAVLNSGDDVIKFSQYDRVAQLLILPVSLIHPIVVEDLDDTERGSGKFGSTGT